MADYRDGESTPVQFEPVQDKALERAIRWIARHGLGRTAPAGPAGLIAGVDAPELMRMHDSEVLEFLTNP